jgi:outer membrane protein OmpA-like peptidoglycan-associated protein
MTRSKQLAAIVTLAFVAVLANATYTFAQGNMNQVPMGQKVKLIGIVIRRDADSFQMKDQTSGAITVVALTPMTTVKTSKGGLFGTSKTYGVSYILRGLRLQAEGVGNTSGQLVANKITFDERDLRTAQALQQTDEMARENQARIAAEEENAKKLAGQIAENQALANQAQASADAAQARADAAMKSADRANSRINGLDDYDVVRTWMILFRPGSAILSLQAKRDIDAGAAWVQGQNTKGWMLEVVGFADTTGNTARNRSLSERRANAVIGYLVMKHNLPLQRLIQPFGYGDSKPVAANNTAEGRAKNRRVEVKILINKGIAGTE